MEDDEIEKGFEQVSSGMAGAKNTAEKGKVLRSIGKHSTRSTAAGSTHQVSKDEKSGS